MTDATAPLAGTPVDPQVADALMQALVKGLRATQLYLPNNPVYQQAIHNVRAAFASVWKETNELVLGVTESDLLLDQRPVLSQPNRSESVAWVLFKDGVRSLTFLRGVEEEEIPRFLGVIHKARQLPADADDDLLTLLWEQDFEYVRYNFVELAAADTVPIPKAPEAPPPAVPEQVRQQVVEETAAPEPPKGIVSLEDCDSTLHFLDDKEREYLTHEVEREYKQDLRGNVLAMLFDLLELQTYSTVRAELISIVENFIPYLLAIGDFRSVAAICREQRALLQRARELLPEHRQQLSDIPAKLSQQEALAQLLQSLDEASVHPTEEELGELFRELRPQALDTVLAWMPKLVNQRVRELLSSAAQRLAQAHPADVSRVLGAGDEAILLQAVKLVAQLKLPPVAPALGALFETASPAVKVAAVEALAAIGTSGAMQQLEKAVDDGDRDVRIAAVRVLSARGHRNVLGRIEAAVDGKALREADLTEKMAFFEAYGLLVGDEGVAALDAVLNRGGFLKRKEDPQTRACAAMALGRIGSPAARTALEQASADKEALVRSAVGRALRGLPGAGGGAEA
ncbi:MAG: HEAT repeat domain-containing protein [Gemmatimonadetes bacterium]|nr:HEAT repeat domain-containing protein [Gemmatimonadota bacterium]